MTDPIFLPTPAACQAIGFKRFPSKYKEGIAPGTERKAASSIGLQYEKFGNTMMGDSLQNLEIKENFNPRDIVIEVLSNTPYTIKTETSPNGVTKSVYNYGDGNVKQDPKYIFHISPTTGDEVQLEFTHSHEWSSSASIFDKILTGAADLIGNVDAFITKAGNISKGLQGQANSDAYKATPNRRVDIAETYVSSEKQSITIPFVLFTPGGEENFIRDIYAPIMTLTQISYPKRTTSLGDTDKFISSVLGVKKDKGGVSGTDANGNQTKQTDVQILDAINAINPGFRVFVSEPPSYINVYHNGGLFKYNNCFITKFSYRYRYWVDGDGAPIKDSTLVNATITDFSLKNAKIAYPLVAECSLEIKTTEPLFADDFVALSEQYSQNRKNQ